MCEIHLEEAVKASSQIILRGQQGAFGPNDPAWFATRADEFVVLLEKVRVNMTSNPLAYVPHVRFSFYRFLEACQLARLSYQSEDKFVNIAKGEMTHDPRIMNSVHRKIGEKSDTLRGFFL